MIFEKTTIETFNNWLEKPEDYNLEFKEAKIQISRSKDLSNYCVAISNEGGGKFILGVTNKREIVGTNAFIGTHNTLSNYLLNKIKIRVDVEELTHPEGRILIFHIPSYSPGKPLKSNGIYLMRAGESLTEMDEETLRQKLNEVIPDFSAQIVNGLTLEDLDDNAVGIFKQRWSEKIKREDYLKFSNEKILRSIGLLTQKGLNYASLILFGKKEKIDELMSGSEIIFEWRQEPGKIPHDFRASWRGPFFKIYHDIWKTINARNIRIPFQEGLIQREVYAFSEKPVREAILNAVAHRDYSINQKSIFINASPEKFVIESPGGFPYGITLENILHERAWRNRKIAEVFEKAGLVERSGQGMDDIFHITIKEGKGLPDLSDSNDYLVKLKIPARIKDKQFILFLEKIANEKQISFSFEEIYELEKIREKQIIDNLEFRKKFLDLGIIEKIGKSRGTKYILSHNYYVHEGKTGIHTRVKGISRDKYKELVLNHLKKNKKGFSKDFKDAFPELKPMDVSNLLRELRIEGKIFHTGHKSIGYWQMSDQN